MSLTYGFYNSVNEDRKYDAEQMSSIFDGLITDGVYPNYGQHFEVTSYDDDMTVCVLSGRAWFNHTWTLNDGNYIVNLGSPSANPRIDAICIEIDKRDDHRENKIVVVKGTPDPSNHRNPNIRLNLPSDVYRYALAYVFIDPNRPLIPSRNIRNVVGTDETPFVIGIVDSTIQQEVDEMTEVFEELKNSVGDGKTLVARAITAMIKTVATTSTFQQLADAINGMTLSFTVNNSGLVTVKNQNNAQISSYQLQTGSGIPEVTSSIGTNNPFTVTANINFTKGWQGTAPSSSSLKLKLVDNGSYISVVNNADTSKEYGRITLTLQNKEVTAGTFDKSVAADSGKHLNTVTVHPTPSQSKTVDAPVELNPGEEGYITIAPDTGRLLSEVKVNNMHRLRDYFYAKTLSSADSSTYYDDAGNPKSQGGHVYMAYGTGGYTNYNNYIGRPVSDFGTAQAEDVKSGKTFTATGGFKAIGTFSAQTKYSSYPSTSTSETVEPDSGKYLSKVIVRQYRNPGQDPWQINGSSGSGVSWPNGPNDDSSYSFGSSRYYHLGSGQYAGFTSPYYPDECDALMLYLHLMVNQSASNKGHIYFCITNESHKDDNDYANSYAYLDYVCSSKLNEFCGYLLIPSVSNFTAGTKSWGGRTWLIPATKTCSSFYVKVVTSSTFTGSLDLYGIGTRSGKL